MSRDNRPSREYKYTFTPEMDNLIVFLFQCTDYTLSQIAEKAGVPKVRLRRRLGELREAGKVGYRHRPVRGVVKNPRAFVGGRWVR